MKQVFAAGPLAEFPTVTALSSGLSPDAVQAALGSARYAAPADGKRPVRLALLRTPAAGRVLAHVAPHEGRYFAHALLNVPPTADAQLAIQTWGSPHWQRHAPDSSADLPELPYLPVADVLDDAALVSWLDSPAHRDLLEFALQALLGTSSFTRVVLGADADDVAKVVYAVTRALPSGLLDEFTFSTYEPDPLTSPARLIGHDGELPAAAFVGECVGFDPLTGKRSALATEVPFAAYAVSALASGTFDKLDEVKATWQRLGLTAGRHFDLVFRLTRGTGVLTKPEAAEALSLPAVAAWVAARSDAMQQFLEWAVEDRQFANESFSRAVQAVRQKADVLAKLAAAVREHGSRALADGDVTKAATTYEVLLPIVAPAKANAVWGDLLAQLADPNALGWPVRWYLLPRFVKFKQSAAVDAAFGRWLDVPTERLGELLALDLSRAYQLAAGRAALARAGEPTPELAKMLSVHPKLTLTLLTAESDASVKLFETLLSVAPAHPWLEDLLAAAGDYPRSLLNRFFETALASGTADADRLIRARGDALLELFSGQSGLDRLGTQLLASPPADLLDTRPLLDFLGKLPEQESVTDALKARIAAVRTVRAYLDKPDFEPDTLSAVSAALGVTPSPLPASARTEVFSAAAAGLLARGTQESLEAAVLHLGSAVATGPADLYENLLRELRARADFGRLSELVHAFLAVALGATKHPGLAGQLDNLDGHAFAVAKEAADRGGHRALDELDRRAKDWPKEARTKWGFLLAAVRPRARIGRDLACAVVGGVVATAIWWAVRLMG